MTQCGTCGDTLKTPASFGLGGNNAHPAHIHLGPCPACSGGDVCPWCLYKVGMSKDENGRAKCRCGWSAEYMDARMQARKATP